MSRGDHGQPGGDEDSDAGCQTRFSPGRLEKMIVSGTFSAASAPVGRPFGVLVVLD